MMFQFFHDVIYDKATFIAFAFFVLPFLLLVGVGIYDIRNN